MHKRFLIFGAISGAVAVALGAMGAHFLKQKMEAGLLTIENLAAFETAVRYQMYHSILLLIIFSLYNRFSNNYLTKAAYSIVVGIILFSGSIYILSTASILGLNQVHFLGPITPIGGIFLIAGWVLLALGLITSKDKL